MSLEGSLPHPSRYFQEDKEAFLLLSDTSCFDNLSSGEGWEWSPIPEGTAPGKRYTAKKLLLDTGPSVWNCMLMGRHQGTPHRGAVVVVSVTDVERIVLVLRSRTQQMQHGLEQGTTLIWMQSSQAWPLLLDLLILARMIFRW